MSNGQETQGQATLSLRLRPSAPTELLRPRQQIKQPDGPWIAHPGLIDEERYGTKAYPVDITMGEYRDLQRADQEESNRALKNSKTGDIVFTSVIQLAPSIDMQRMRNKTDHEIALATEKYYVGAHHYLSPRVFLPPLLVDRFGRDWGMNARGIYYRHYYSPGWVTADHSLWLPSLDGTDWNHNTEESRRERAKSFLKHVLDNENWNKSEYAWEADAWTDVFGLMRNDPVLAVDKHEYNTMGRARHPVSCVLTGQSKFIKRVPDATFGLATFQPKDYQNKLAEWDLDRDRLESLLLHRHCGLISDPRWGDTSLVFPFAVYEAKGWSGDAREARQQACSAGAVYLDMLDSLARHPGKIGTKCGAYQNAESRNSQVFVFTSFGAHWHILVGYKRPRLKREHAGCEGMSESAYLFQRIWSCRVTTERKAWELLSLVDQIHLWGATDFRDFVIQHLKPWHEFGRICYINDIRFINTVPGTGSTTVNGKPTMKLPALCLELPEWAKDFTEYTRLNFLKNRAAFHLTQAYNNYQGAGIRAEFPDFKTCAMGDCGPLTSPGYPMATMEDFIIHLREIHGEDDTEIAKAINACERGHRVKISSPLFNPIEGGELRRGKKRRVGDAIEVGTPSKKKRD